ncbi:MAG: TIGR02270 family protein [Gammaproteobacteria bacterium]|nr:TIGR02270 family protein [Gammaproteobacteria bacterium]
MDQTIPDYMAGASKAYRDIYEQYVDEASFLWMLRSIVVNQPHYTKQDLLELENRIEAQIEGLMTSMSEGWEACEAALKLEEAGEVFTATIVAFRSHDMENIKKAVEVGLTNDSTYKGLISALGWLPDKLVGAWIERFLSGKDMNHKYLGVAACSLKRQDPGEQLLKILNRPDCQEHHKLYARSLRLIGELRRQDLLPALNVAMNHDDPEIKFWALWSSILLGNKSLVKHLKPFVLTSGPFSSRAINIAFRVLPVEEARKWISEMATKDGLNRAVIKATGILGDPHAVNWLIGQMAKPEYARLAAESFSMITGIDLEQHQLSMDIPDNAPLIPNNNVDDDDVSLDEDENLPWPDVSKVVAIWRRQGQNFIIGQRYFLGRPLNSELLRNKLEMGFQRQRHAAAMELALTDPEYTLVNTKGKASARF